MQTKFCHSCQHVVEGNQRNVWAVSGYTRSLGRFCGCCAVILLTVLLILLGECLYEITIYDHHLTATMVSEMVSLITQGRIRSVAVFMSYRL